jgi:xanthine dehydrogenase accessory factor
MYSYVYKKTRVNPSGVNQIQYYIRDVNMYKSILNAIQSGKPIAILSTYASGSITKKLVDKNTSNGEILCTIEDGNITLLERYVSKPRLIVLGGGHIAVPLCLFAAKLDFFIAVCDDRPYFANSLRFPDADLIICDQFEKAITSLSLRKNDSVVIVTRGHRHDSICLQEIVNGRVFPGYVGMIGSKRRAKIVMEDIVSSLLTDEQISKIHTPIGLPIGAVTPEEIALSIMAEVIQERRKCSDKTFEARLDMEIINWIINNETKNAILVTVLSTKGSTPMHAGAKMLITPHGQTIGSIGGGCAEAEVIREARRMLDSASYGIIDVDLSDTAAGDGMVCGGTMVVLYEKADCYTLA